MAYEAHDRTAQLHSQLQDAHRQLKDAHARIDGMQKEMKAGGPSNTKIAGLYVIGQPPTDQDRLTYDAATGQLIWKP